MYHNVFANKTYFHNFESDSIDIFQFDMKISSKPINNYFAPIVKLNPIKDGCF